MPPPSARSAPTNASSSPLRGSAGPRRRRWLPEGYRTSVEELEGDLYALTVEPELAIGQRGLIVRTPGGNLLWEPPGYLDQEAIEAVRDLGGLTAVSASHPHLTGASIQWSHAFGGVPVLVAAPDLAWIRRPDPVIELWAGVRQVLPEVNLHPVRGTFRRQRRCALGSRSGWTRGAADR